MPDGLRLALTTLTVARVRGPGRLDRRTAGQAMELAPLIGLLLGLAAAAVVYGARRAETGSLVAAVVGIATLALLTRGLHLDGLVDLTDGLGSYRDPEATRAVMKAPDAGPLGISALTLVLLLQVAALQSCIEHGRGTASLVLAVVVGRLAVTAACARTPAATHEGLGALVAQTVRRGVSTTWVVGVAVAAAAYATLDPDGVGSDTRRAVQCVLAVLLAMSLTWLLRRHAVRRVGGLTGDVLGALSEVGTAVSLVMLAGGWS